MAQKELSQADVDNLNKSVNSPETIKRLKIFFGTSPRLQRLKIYAENQGIKFGISKSEISKNKTVRLGFITKVIFSEDGKPKEKIILIPDILSCRIFAEKYLDIALFSVAHEIGHAETLLEIETKKCDIEKENCLYKELIASDRALDILKKNIIRIKQEVFYKCVSDGFATMPEQPVCLKMIRTGLCPYASAFTARGRKNEKKE